MTVTLENVSAQIDHLTNLHVHENDVVHYNDKEVDSAVLLTKTRPNHQMANEAVQYSQISCAWLI